MTESLKNKTVKGTVWSSIERFSVQGIQFIVTVLMARILTPSDYGIVGMITIFIAISSSFVDSGFSQSLIRKQDRSEIDNATVFYFNIVVGIVFYLLLFFLAPIIANFYKEPILVPITRIIGLSLVFNSFAVVQRALLTVQIDFKTQAKASFTSTILSGSVGIYMAYLGFGVWAIVWQQVTNVAINTLSLWILSRWKPIWAYSWESFTNLFGFGSKLLASGLIDTLYNNIYLIVVGKVFKASDLGYYTRANQFSDFASSNLTSIFSRVTFPILCSIQNDDARLWNIYSRLLRVSCYVIFPLMLGMTAVSRPMIVCFLTDKWLFSAKLLVPICLASMWYPVHGYNLNILQVKGRSDLFLKLEIYKKIVGVVILVITIPLGLYAMCWGRVVTSLIGLIINTHYSGKLLNMGLIKQLSELFPILIIGFIMASIVYATVTFIPMRPIFALAIGIAEGVCIYLFLSKIFKFDELSELIAIIKRK